MAYNFSSFDSAVKQAEEWLSREYQSVSAGRATPSILDLVQVDSYGSMMAIGHVASITIEDPRTLRVTPWDKSQVKGIERAINDADLGLSVSTDDAGLRIFFPQLTTERRTHLVKVLKEKLEEARVKVRSARQEAVKDIESQKKDGGMPEDDAKRALDELQAKVDAVNTQLEKHFEKKEGEVMS